MNKQAIRKLAVESKASCEALSILSSETKNKALLAMSEAVLKNSPAILKANQKDVLVAKKNGLAPAMIGRLELSEDKLRKIAGSISSIAKLPDPVGRLISETKRPNGLLIKKVGVPIGSILIIYESRPNVTADCMALCLKSGNSVILKGGREAFYTNRVLFEVLDRAAVRLGVPKGAFKFVATSERAAVRQLLEMNDLIDLVIPRGGEGLIREVAKISRIPVIKHFKGVCHVYVDRSADLKKAEAIIINAKVQNPGVCNAMESLLVHRSIAKDFLPQIAIALKDKGVEIRGSEEARAILKDIKKASQKDWGAEYLDLILSLKVVKDLDEAVAHIQKYGSHHSDAIITEDRASADKFTHTIDSACVFVNSSTRFNDGGEFGMGAEMGISTDKLHARGPMGLEELTSYKYIVLGNGQTRK